MKTKFSEMEKREIVVDYKKTEGALCYRHHSIGVGGINHLPLPAPVVNGTRRLKPKLVRIFLQEFFFVYPDHYVFDWAKMDAYIKAVHETGADIMAHITIKPKPLYPVIDEYIWEPNNIEEWQNLIAAMVMRYSVENKYISHWAVANEINIGELGGCPYKFDTAEPYFEYYKITVEAIIKTGAKVQIGGPAWAGTGDNFDVFLTKFFQLVEEHKLPLDFISYNTYHDDPVENLRFAQYVRGITDKYRKDLGVYITEINVGLLHDVEETAYLGARAACLAAILMTHTDAGLLDGTFQYHLVDQLCIIDDFAEFYSRSRYMSDHWNDYPHRLGLFDWDGNARPQYFMYELMYKMSGERIKTTTDDSGNFYHSAIKTTDKGINIFVTNFNMEEQTDIKTNIQLKNNPEGLYRLEVFRVDDEKRWDDNLNLKPIESRIVCLGSDFKFPVYMPGYSCTLIQLTKI